MLAWREAYPNPDIPDLSDRDRYKNAVAGYLSNPVDGEAPDITNNNIYAYLRDTGFCLFLTEFTILMQHGTTERDYYLLS